VLKIEDLYAADIRIFAQTPYRERKIPLDITDFQHVDLYQFSLST
jgi:hypothetical protein